MLRLANGLLLAAPLVLLAGVGGFLVASTPASWDELVDGVRWYAIGPASSWPVLGTLAAGLLTWVGWMALALRNRGRFRADAVARAAASRIPDQDRQLRLARRSIDRALRSRPPDAGLGPLLGAMVDLDARELCLEPGEMLVSASVELQDRSRQPLCNLTDAQWKALREQAGQIGALGEAPEADGELDLRSPGGDDTIAVHREQGPRGAWLRFRLLAPAAACRSPRPVLLRPEARPPERRPTGELARLNLPGPDDTTDSGSGLLTGLEPSAETEIAPVVKTAERRPVRGAELWVRLSGSALITVLLAVVFVPAHAWGLRYLLRGEVTAPWREVEVRVQSRPTGADVQVGGEPRGRTPGTFREPCGGRRLQVMVEARGYAVWQWTGICPGRGVLWLEAVLQPVR
jgi:hypothetical protein